MLYHGNQAETVLNAIFYEQAVFQETPTLQSARSFSSLRGIVITVILACRKGA